MKRQRMTSNGLRVKSRREVADMLLPPARDALLDAAAEVAAILGGAPEPSRELGDELAKALGRLYRANDGWQEAQITAALEAPRRST